MEPGDADDADDGAPFRLPLPPEDRLWRHPSELGAPVRRRRRAPWRPIGLSAVTGAVLTVGVLAAAGAFDGGGPRHVVVQEASTTSVPAAPSADDVLRIAEAVAPAIVVLGSGTGIVFRDDGHVLTTARAVAGVQQLDATMHDGRHVAGRVVASDVASDVAVVKLEAPMPYATALLGTSSAVAPGDPAIVIGTGISSGRVREVGGDHVDAVHIDVSGASGGAVLDRNGTVIGLLATGHVAIPVDVARAAADDLIHVGRVRTVWLGIRGETRSGGVRVAAVMLGSPAVLGGLQVGDVVRRVDGRSVGSMTAVRLALRRHHPGDRVVVAYDREGTRRSCVVVLAERPA